MTSILAPVHRIDDVEKLAEAGADEFFCGVMPENWKQRYTPIVSPNRREWSSANLQSFAELKEVVKQAHRLGRPVFLTLNALYTGPQCDLVQEQLAAAHGAGVDALIVADMGLLLTVRKQMPAMNIHVSTGGTSFNVQTVKLFEELGASRVTIPRHCTPEEVRGIARSCPSLQLEVFALNGGCKNIDGFCTFLHGMFELNGGRNAVLRNLKRMNVDQIFLKWVHKAFVTFNCTASPGFIKADSPCLFNYDIAVRPETVKTPQQVRRVKDNVASYYRFLAGANPCAACRAAEFSDIGVHGLKIVGRGHTVEKTTTDISFLRQTLQLVREYPSPALFRSQVKRLYRKSYGVNCGNLCYYPDDTND